MASDGSVAALPELLEMCRSQAFAQGKNTDWRSTLAMDHRYVTLEVVSDRVVLESYSVLWSSLALGGPSIVDLVWRVDGEVRNTLACPRNLITNGGFGLLLVPLTDDAIPTSFWRAYNADPATIRLSVKQCAGGVSVVVGLHNSITQRRSGLISAIVPVDPGGLYLFGGWMAQADGGNPAIHLRWYSSEIGLGSYVGEPVLPRQVREAAGWEYVVGLAAVPRSASLARLWLVNIDTTGSAYFDDVFIWKLARPSLKQGEIDQWQ